MVTYMKAFIAVALAATCAAVYWLCAMPIDQAKDILSVLACIVGTIVGIGMCVAIPYAMWQGFLGGIRQVSRAIRDVPPQNK